MTLARRPRKSEDCTNPVAHDRARVVAVAIMRIVNAYPHDRVRAVAAYLRDEFNDVERQVIDDLRRSDV
jgi:hypothetical protein